jgi:hypothetical protein
LELSVYRHEYSAGSGVIGLYHKTTPLEGSPQVGDTIELWLDGPEHTIIERSWTHEGRLWLRLQSILWLPTRGAEQMAEEQIMRSVGSGRHPAISIWRDEDEAGDGLYGGLDRGGWTPYAVYHLETEPVLG